MHERESLIFEAWPIQSKCALIAAYRSNFLSFLMLSPLGTSAKRYLPTIVAVCRDCVPYKYPSVFPWPGAMELTYSQLPPFTMDDMSPFDPMSIPDFATIELFSSSLVFEFFTDMT